MAVNGPTDGQGQKGPSKQQGDDESNGPAFDEEPETGKRPKKNVYGQETLNDRMTKQDRHLLLNLTKEMYQEAEALIFGVGSIIQMHEPAMGFEVGKIIGLIQAKYRIQSEFWRQISNKEVSLGYPPRTRIWPPTWSTPWFWVFYQGWLEKRPAIRSNDYFIYMYVLIWELERDINQLIDSLLVIPREQMGLGTLTIKITTTTIKTRTPSTTTKKRRTRPPGYPEESYKHRDDPDPPPVMGWNKRKSGRSWNEGRRNFLEEKYKHRIREQYLLRKLGLNDSGHTPKPRFRQGWPIDDTWDDMPMS